ncbi:NaeI family type II restriction endonuclease [Rhodococcus erythropolis]|uniref:NaeI family type II restriction endonuclease n=1 Tax=Rhodococcus erythropolis TaxID=1833 RepID=UPI00087912F9|nr:NaeI family type II restriction endonuclease [Rhodococcus erythropolis]MDF2468964.1 type restriction enzyme [Rhodococcus erythropolis]OFV75135.1 type-2 restriction enzyme NaeI [Rhodococcus erythropolis]
MTTFVAPIDPPDSADTELDEVVAEILRLDPDGSRWAAVVRHTYDMIYNGAETGRYRWDQLMKTEKTHFGTLFEINAQREFGFDGGDETDYRIAGHQVDAKWSQKKGSWMLPPEVFGRLALVATGNDERSEWSLGLIRVNAEYRSASSNRDMKSTLNALGRSKVHWIWHEAPMPSNVLLQLPRATVDAIFELKAGTQRTNQLFRVAEGQLVHRSAVRTVAMQLDDQKRVRKNGGARSALAPEGFVILSGAYHRRIAVDLGVPVPNTKEYISVRVVPSDDSNGALIDGAHWRRAMADEISTVCAPTPTHGS